MEIDRKDIVQPHIAYYLPIWILAIESRRKLSKIFFPFKEQFLQLVLSRNSPTENNIQKSKHSACFHIFIFKTVIFIFKIFNKLMSFSLAFSSLQPIPCLAICCTRCPWTKNDGATTCLTKKTPCDKDQETDLVGKTKRQGTALRTWLCAYAMYHY